MTYFRNDLTFADTVFFIGYSLYDIDIRRILYQHSIKNKCIFIVGKSPNETIVRRAHRFGTVCDISLGEFANYIQTVKRKYIPRTKTFYPLSIRETTPSKIAPKIEDRDFFNLLLFGVRNQEMISESLNTKTRYFLERDDTKQVFDQIDQGFRLFVVCSDLGNGKSTFLDGLRFKALEYGFRVFETRERNEKAIAELDALSSLNEKLFITIEGYQDWISEIRQFRLKAKENCVLILSARNAIHDVSIDSLTRELKLDNIPEIHLDILNDPEIEWFVDALEEYGLWGKTASAKRDEKINIIKYGCKSQIHALLIKIMDSPDIGKRLQELVITLKQNRAKYETLLGICVMNVLNQSLEMPELVELFGPDIFSNVQFRKDPVVKQFLDFNQGKILMKSPVTAQYILNRLADPAFTVDILVKMATKSHNSSKISDYYYSMFTNLIRFGNLQMLLPEQGKAGAIISYYESIKNLQHCKNSPLFWLQYAIACLVIDDLDRSKRYFQTSYSLANKTSFNPYQIDNHYARFLLVEAIEKLELKPALDNFRASSLIINRQIKVERLRYPYRVACEYRRFFDRFSSSFTANQFREVSQAANAVKENIDLLPPYHLKHKIIIDCREAMEYIIAKSAKILQN
jgi:hypothetical protein